MRAAALGSLLAFTAGAVDTLGFIALFGLFSAHVTGNFVLIGAALTHDAVGLIGKLLALPVFIAGVALTRLHLLRHPANGRGVMVTQVALLALFMAAGLLAVPFSHPDSPAAILVGLLAVAPMAVQNAASRTVFASLAPTTVMTGNVTQIVIDMVDLAKGQGGTEARGRLRRFLPAVLAFTAGALIGAFGFLYYGFWALGAPLGCTLLVVALMGGGAKA
jgi:uncharacterized membrane protein YoaK (UPF0700 family)